MVSEIKMLEAFRKVKTDVVKLQKQVIDLNQTQKQLLSRLAAVEKKKSVKKTTTIVKKVARKKKTEFIAAKGGDKFHVRSCPFAKNIKRGHRIVYKSKVAALTAGHKPCTCVQ